MSSHSDLFEPNRALVNVADLVGPIPLNPFERHVDVENFVGIDTCGFFHADSVTQEQVLDDIKDLASLFRQTDPDRTTINFTPLVVHEIIFNELLEVIGNIRALVIAPRFQFTCGDFIIADVEQKKPLDRVDL